MSNKKGWLIRQMEESRKTIEESPVWVRNLCIAYEQDLRKNCKTTILGNSNPEKKQDNATCCENSR